MYTGDFPCLASDVHCLRLGFSTFIKGVFGVFHHRSRYGTTVDELFGNAGNEEAAAGDMTSGGLGA